jgi:hypothetical protein
VQQREILDRISGLYALEQKNGRVTVQINNVTLDVPASQLAGSRVIKIGK